MQLKMEKLHTVSKIILGVDYGSDQELLVAKFRLKFKKVGKTLRPFRYDVNQIPYDYKVEVRNRLKVSSDSHFAFLHFFFLGTVLITASWTMSRTSNHYSSGTLSIRPNPLNIFVASTV